MKKNILVVSIAAMFLISGSVYAAGNTTEQSTNDNPVSNAANTNETASMSGVAANANGNVISPTISPVTNQTQQQGSTTQAIGATTQSATGGSATGNSSSNANQSSASTGASTSSNGSNANGANTNGANSNGSNSNGANTGTNTSTTTSAGGAVGNTSAATGASTATNGANSNGANTGTNTSANNSSGGTSTSKNTNSTGSQTTGAQSASNGQVIGGTGNGQTTTLGGSSYVDNSRTIFIPPITPPTPPSTVGIGNVVQTTLACGTLQTVVKTPIVGMNFGIFHDKQIQQGVTYDLSPVLDANGTRVIYREDVQPNGDVNLYGSQPVIYATVVAIASANNISIGGGGSSGAWGQAGGGTSGSMSQLVTNIQIHDCMIGTRHSVPAPVMISEPAPVFVAPVHHVHKFIVHRKPTCTVPAK